MKLLDLFRAPQRILVLGSSVSIQKNGYLFTLIEELNRHIGQDGQTHTLLNASLGGTHINATLAYAANNLFYDVRSFNPTFTIIEKAPNNRISNYRGLPEVQQKNYVLDSCYGLSRLIAYIKSLGCAHTTCITTYIHDLDIIGQHSERASYLSEIDRIACENSRSYHIDLAYRLYQAYREDFKNLLLDDVHPNEEGAKVVSSHIVEMLGELPISQVSKPHNGALASPPPTAIFPPNIYPRKTFSTRLISADYVLTTLNSVITLDLAPPLRGWITGLFYIANPESGIICIANSEGETRVISLFDHYCFMERIHYLPLRPPLKVGNKLSISIQDKPVDRNRALRQYENSKTFDPTEEWAKVKYLNPLLEAIKSDAKSLRLIAIIVDQHPTATCQ